MSDNSNDSNSEKTQSDLVQQHIGKYSVLGMLGRGSTGIVYLGFDPQLQRKVAIKVLHLARLSAEPSSEFRASQHVVKRFMAEAQSTGKLRHQNIIALHEGSVHGPMPYLVMEYVEGSTLDVLIKSGKRMPTVEVIELLKQLADAIDYAHSQGVLHRDIKPANILIDHERKPYILDFGVAKIHEQISAEDEGVRATSVLGTPAYMSPEQIRNKPLNNQSDLFAFAIVAFQCLCGTRPFDGETFTAVAASILEKMPKRVSSYRNDLPSAVDQVFFKALSKERSARYESASEFINQLEKSLESEDINESTEDLVASVISNDLSTVKVLANKAAKISVEASLKPNQREPLPSAYLRNIPSVERKTIPGANLSFFIFFAGLIIGVFLIGAYFFWPRKTLLVVAGQENRVESSQVPEQPAAQMSNQDLIAIQEAEISTELVSKILNTAASAEELPGLLARLKERASLPYEIKVNSLLNHQSFLVKVAALKVIIDKKENQSLKQIVPMLDDPDPLVRGFAAKAIGVLADSSYSTILARRATYEPVPEVLRALETAIERMADRSQQVQ